MTNYYNSLCSSGDTVHKKTRFGASGGSPNTTKTPRWWLASLFMIMSLFMGQFSFGQIALPYSETFAGITVANGFPTVTGGAWTRSGTTTTQPTYIANQSSYNRSGNGDTKFMAFNWNASTRYYFVGPFDLTSGVSYTSSCLYRADGATGFGPLELTYGTTAAAATHTNVIASVPSNIVNASYNTISGAFTVATTGSYYLAIKCTANGNPWYLSVDDFKLNVTPTCFSPIGLTNSAVTTTSANHSWSAPASGAPVDYEWAVTTSATPPTSGTTGAGLSASSSSLTPNTTYYLHVRTNCGGGDLSSWATSSFYTGYCVASSTSQSTWLSNFTTTGGLTNIAYSAASGAGGGYQNLSGTYSVSNFLGNATSISLTAGGPTVGFAIWVDWNNNLVFDSGERMYNTTSYSTTVTGSFQIPALTANGNYRMRIITDYNNSNPTSACGSITTGQFNDFNFEVVSAPALPPGCATALLPADLSIDIAKNPVLSWSAGTNFPLSYDVYFGNAPGAPLVSAAQAGLTYTPAVLNANTTYYWKVVAKNATGDATGCAEQSFTTGTTINFCTPTYTTGKTGGDLIANIAISGTTLANNSGATAVNPAYTYFTGQPNYTGDLQAGASYSVSATVGSFGNQNIAAWIDYNDDGVFSSTERIGYTTTSIGSNGTASFNISLACNPPLGVHRMRIRDVYANTGSSIDPCANYGYGETEDYDVNVTTADPCPVPKNLASSALTAVGSTLAWELGCAETQWDVLVQLATDPAPTASSTPSNPGLTATTLVATGLNSNTAYNAYVRAVCDSGLGVYSNWTAPVAFTTQGVPNCATALVPADLATNVVRNSSMSWTAATGNPAVTSYDVYFGNSSPAPFVVNQTAVTYTPATMDANTTYYWKVVAKNSIGDAVGCIEQSFTTGTTITYCVPSTSSGCTDGDVIGKVVLNTLVNESGVGCPSGLLGYSDYTTDPLLTTELQAGSTYSCTVTAGEYSGSYAAWIDYNDDGVFDPVTERIGFTSTPVVGSGADSGLLGASASFPITLSCNPPLGVHRLRVREMYNIAGSAMTPCGSNSYGEVEDYLITITAPDPCPVPSTLTASAAAATSATLGWKQGCAEAEWDVHVQAVGAGTPSGTPSHPGVLTTSAPGFGTLDVSGLPSGTAYEFYVRAVCETGVLTSNWAGPYTFITVAPGCTSISTPAVTTNLPLGVTVINWDAPAVSASQSAATSYDVYSGTTSGALTLAGNFVSGPLNFTISAYGTYYVQVIPKNAAGEAVGCVETTFTTIPDPCAGVNNVGDTFADPIVVGELSATPYSNSGNTLDANCWRNDFDTTTGITAPVASTSNDVFYQFSVADACNTVTLGVCAGTLTDTYLHILDSSGTSIAFDDDSCTTPNSLGSQLTLNNLAIGTYYAVVEAYGADAEGTYTLDITYTGSSQNTYYVDADGDNYGNSALPTVLGCTKPTGYALLDGDCDDTNPARNPGLAEVLYNGIDDNCDGQLDEGFERTTVLNSSSCSANLVALYTSISAEIKSGVTGYRFEVTNLTNPLAPVQTIDRTVQWFTLTQLASYDYSTTYSIRVMLRVGSTWLGYYGETCTVSTPDVSSPTGGSATVVSPVCGTKLATMSSNISTNLISGVTGYKYRVTRGAEVQELTRTAHWFRLNQLPNYVYGATYTVEVAFKTTGDYTPYGPACTILSPDVPSITSCGQTVNVPSNVYTTVLSGVTQYTFEVTNLTNTSEAVQVINRPNHYLPVSLITGYSSANMYSIRVAVTSTGIQSDYGTACEINVPAPTRLSNGNLTSEFKANGFPNPFTNNFTLDITTTSEEKVSVMVYDMIGKLLDRVEVNATDNALELGANYPAGVYNVIVSQGEKVETVRMVKR